MPVSFDVLVYLVIVAIFWGTTNPFLKKGAHGLENIKASSSFHKFLKQVIYLFTNFKYLIPFFINQCGSVLFVYILGSTDLSLAIPVTNGLTFAFTAAMGWFLEEGKSNAGTYIGTALILIGTTFCCIDKFSTA